MTIVTIALPVSPTMFLKIERGAAAACSHFSATDNQAYGQSSKADGEYDNGYQHDDEYIHRSRLTDQCFYARPYDIMAIEHILNKGGK